MDLCLLGKRDHASRKLQYKPSYKKAGMWGPTDNLNRLINGQAASSNCTWSILGPLLIFSRGASVKLPQNENSGKKHCGMKITTVCEIVANWAIYAENNSSINRSYTDAFIVRVKNSPPIIQINKRHAMELKPEPSWANWLLSTNGPGKALLARTVDREQIPALTIPSSGAI